MERIEDFLISMGFKKNEVAIYLALLAVGTASVLELSRKTKIHRSNVYDILRTLIGKGLVFQTNKETKVFTARPLRGFFEFIKSKEVELESAIKEFESRRMVKDAAEKIKISKGRFAFQSALFNFLNSKSDIKVYGIPKEAPDRVGPILNEFHKERARKKIKMLQIYNSDGKDRARWLNKQPQTEARILDEKYNSSVTTNITGDNVFIVMWDDDLTVLEIKDKNMADHYSNYFDILWEKAKSP